VRPGPLLESWPESPDYLAKVIQARKAPKGTRAPSRTSDAEKRRRRGSKPSTLPASTGWRKNRSATRESAWLTHGGCLLETAAAEPRRRTRKVPCHPQSTRKVGLGYRSRTVHPRGCLKIASSCHRDTLKRWRATDQKSGGWGKMSRSNARKGGRAARSMRSVNAVARHV